MKSFLLNEFVVAECVSLFSVGSFSGGTIKNKAAINLVEAFVGMFFSLLEKYLGVEMLSRGVGMFDSVNNCQLFSKVVVPFHLKNFFLMFIYV